MYIYIYIYTYNILISIYLLYIYIYIWIYIYILAFWFWQTWSDKFRFQLRYTFFHCLSPFSGFSFQSNPHIPFWFLETQGSTVDSIYGLLLLSRAYYFYILCNILSIANFYTVLSMFPFLFYWSHLKTGTDHLSNSSLTRKR